MALLTFGEIVTQGGLLGGNDGVPLWIATKLRAWMRKHYTAWAWPFLIKQATGVPTVAGTYTVDVGNGNGGITAQISRIFGPIYWRGSSYSQRGKAPLRDFVGGPIELQEELQDPTAPGGSPQVVKVQAQQSTGAAGGAMYQRLLLFPIPDQVYSLSFTYQELPADVVGDGDIPQYPNQMTLIQAAKCAAIEYDQSDTAFYQNELQILASMVTADRDAYGGNASFGDSFSLDTSVFLP